MARAYNRRAPRIRAIIRVRGNRSFSSAFLQPSTTPVYSRRRAVVDGREALLEARELFLHRAFTVCNVISPRLGAVTKTLLPISTAVPFHFSLFLFFNIVPVTVYLLSSSFFILHLPQCQSAPVRGYLTEERCFIFSFFVRPARMVYGRV